jgi:hypothetical protein
MMAMNEHEPGPRASFHGGAALVNFGSGASPRTGLLRGGRRKFVAVRAVGWNDASPG